jgi:hypothetical protein
MLKVGSWTVITSVLCGLLGLAGCKSEASVPVEGNIKLNNKPLADATVVFSPSRANGPGPFIGVTDHEGHFSLGLLGKERGGAAPGTYMVMITTVKSDPNAPEGAQPTQKEIVPAAFNDGSKRFDVTATGTKDANFDIKTAPAR